MEGVWRQKYLLDAFLLLSFMFLVTCSFKDCSFGRHVHDIVSYTTAFLFLVISVHLVSVVNHLESWEPTNI